MFPNESHILVVDDSPTSRLVVRELLGKLGYKNLTEADDGLFAVEILEKISNQKDEVRLVIADWNMPRMNGLDLLVYIKQNIKYNGIPVLMFTAESDISLVSLALSNGADEFIIKPVTEENLAEKLQSIWSRLPKS